MVHTDTQRTLRAGTAQAVITPPVGVDLCGYGGRSGPSEGIHDDLAAHTLYLGNDETELLIMSCDLIGLHDAQVDALRRDIHRQTGIGRSRIMVGCSHTHAGPATPCIRYLGRPSHEYLERLHRTLVESADTAQGSAVAAKTAHVRVPVNVGVNRRELRNGAIAIGTNEGGAMLPYADMLAISSLRGDALAVLYCHAAHAVALGGDNLLISADWPGYARRAIQASLGSRCAVLFLQGCCGDINCRERGWDGAERQGGRVAGALLDARGGIGSYDRSPFLAGTIHPLALPLLPPPDVSSAETALKAAEEHLAGLDAGAVRGVRWMAEGAVNWRRTILDLARNPEAMPRTKRFDVQALRVGNLGIVGLPGEVFVQYALAIDADSPLSATAVAAYCNGNAGYIPTADAYPVGGYEVNDAIRYYGDTMPAPESEQLIVTAAGAALADIAR